MKEDKEGRKRGLSMEIVKRAQKTGIPTAYHYLVKIQNNKHNMEVFYKIWKMCNEIQ